MYKNKLLLPLMAAVSLAPPMRSILFARAWLAGALCAGALFAGAARADDTPPPAEPSVFQTERLADGKVIVNVGTPRNAGYGIGASIPIVLVFELQHSKQVVIADPATQPDTSYDPAAALTNVATAPMAPVAKPLPVPRINLEGLAMGALLAEPQDIKFLAPPVVQTYTQGDKDYVRAVFWGWQFVTTQKGADGKPKRQVSVKADFLYAVDTLPDGQPDWKKATTPEMLIDIVPTAGEDQITPREGDLKTKESNHAAIIPYLKWGGVVLMMPLFFMLGRLTYAQYMRPRRLTAGQIFWLEVDPVVEQAEKAGLFSLDDCQKILYELRRFYGVSTLHTADLLKALEAAPNYPTIERIFALEGTFFIKDGTVTPEQHEDLIASLKLLVPRD
jgi:hypothetical protein